jgi:hypothetical protein
MLNDVSQAKADVPGTLLTEAKLLQSCPSCAYCIRGLPVEHKCPECAFEFDRRWLVFGGVSMIDRSPWRLGSWGLLILLVVNIFSILVTLVRHGSVSAVIVLVTLGQAIVVVFLFRRPKTFIVVGPYGVTICRPDRRSHWPWQEIGPARHLVPGQRIEMLCAGERVLIPVRPIFGFNMTETARCVGAINSYPRKESA